MTSQNTPPEASPPASQLPPSAPSGRGPCERRGFRGRGFVLAGIAVFAGLVGFALCHGHHRHHFGMYGEMSADSVQGRVEAGVEHILGSVDATSEQKAQVGEIAKAAVKDLLPLREQQRALREKATALLKAEKVDRATIEQVRTEAVALGDTASKRFAQAIGDAAEVLTPAQRARLLDRWQSRWPRG
jgi:periplasmic protein CpxP/Spy